MLVFIVRSIAIAVSVGSPSMTAAGSLMTLVSMMFFLVTVLRHGFGGSCRIWSWARRSRGRDLLGAHTTRAALRRASPDAPTCLGCARLIPEGEGALRESLRVVPRLPCCRLEHTGLTVAKQAARSPPFAS